MNHLTKAVLAAAVLITASLAYANEAPASQQSYRIKRHDLKIEVNPTTSFIAAQDRITLIPQGGSTSKLELLLRKGLSVKKVWWEKKKLRFSVSEKVNPAHFEAEVDSEDASFYGRAQTISIEIPSKAAKKDELAVRVEYEGVVKDSLAGADFSREYVAEQITAFAGPEGIYLAPEGVYYPTLPDQLFTYSLEVTLPPDFQSVSEGIDRQPVIQEGKRTETWVCEHSIDGFHLLGGKYQINSLEHEGVKISTYFFPDTTDLSQRYLTACADYISLYDSLLGRYPFEKFAVVENFFATGYGMPSFTLLGSEVIRLPFIISTSLGHEVCHNWWGNSVFVDYPSGNWCEGLTTYCADYLYKERKSPADAAEYRIGLDRDYTAYTHESNDFALTDFRVRHNPAQRAVGYGKSALVYHMLRRRIGDDAFWVSLQDFYKDNIFKFASWSDVQKAFEGRTGEKLGWFFDQWVKRVGAPQLAIESPQLQQTSDRWQISFDLLQKQAGDPYVLDVPVRVKGAETDSQFTVPARCCLERVKLQTSFKPVSFAVDPNFDLFRRLDRAEIAPTLAEVLGAQNLILVLPTKVTPELVQAYENLASQLNREGHYRILKDRDLKREDLSGNSLFFLGTPSENAAIPAKWLRGDRWAVSAQGYRLLGTDHTDAQAALLAVERHPNNSDVAIAYFSGRSAAGVSEAGRKLPHYGKYSYLVFYGGKNQVKGTWETTDSPLSYRF